ncbi:MAG: gamma carbonic anhydrase family protein [Alphaproteobacteria bacterium BRH_c36]|nr:MAG: gamma carbonic anhydrase family protein [Alphaproteobacteria bacterium BRH_c36]
MPLYALDAEVKTPANGRYWVAPTATVIGNVDIREDASVWFGTVIRGDNEPIVLGERVNIQENCVLHTDPGYPMTIHPDCTIGHIVMLHGCTVEPGALVGIGSIVLNGAVIGEGSLIGANSLIPEGKVIPPRSLVVGSPGRIIRELTAEQVAEVKATAGRYVQNWQRFRGKLRAQDS